MHRVRTRRGKRARANFASRFHETAGVDAGNSPRVRVGPAMPGIHLCRSYSVFHALAIRGSVSDRAVCLCMVRVMGIVYECLRLRSSIKFSVCSFDNRFFAIVEGRDRKTWSTKKKVKPGLSDYVIPRAGDAGAGKIRYMTDSKIRVRTRVPAVHGNTALGLGFLLG